MENQDMEVRIKVIVIIPVGLEAKHGDLRFCIKLSLFERTKYFDLSKILANYFMNRLPEDTICYWDLIFDDSSREEKIHLVW